MIIAPSFSYISSRFPIAYKNWEWGKDMHKKNDDFGFWVLFWITWILLISVFIGNFFGDNVVPSKSDEIIISSNSVDK